MDQMILADQVSAQLGKLSFIESWETPKKFFGCDQPQYCVAQKLKLLIIRSAFGGRGTKDFGFSRLRTVSQRLVEQLSRGKRVPEHFFQTLDFARVRDHGRRHSVARGSRILRRGRWWWSS